MARSFASGRFDDALLEQIRQRVSLVDEVRKVVPSLKKKGRHYWACCPFHSEKTPSFSIREQGDFYHCFGCGAHGDVFSLVMETQSKTFPEAVSQLALQAGVKLPEIQRDPAVEKTRNDGFKALARAQVFYQRQVDKTKAYLDKRQLKPEIIQTFGLGYAPDSFGETRNALLNEGFTPEILRQIGVAVESDRGKEDYDRFRGRLMFPIHDLQDRVVGFGGRVLGQGEPKYLNSPETAFFDKSSLLYNLNRAKGEIRHEQRLLLVEGYMDVIALWQQGLKTAVAPMGTAVTPTQIQTLWRFHNKPLVCLDGDSAGQKAASRMARRALEVIKPGVDLGFVWLPEGEDPDSFVASKGKAAFETLLKQAAPLEEVLWRDVVGTLDVTSGTGRAAVEQEIYMLMGEVRHDAMKRHLTRALKDRLWAAGRQGGKQKAAPMLVQGQGTYVPKTQDSLMRNLLGLMALHPFLIGQFEEELSELQLDDPVLQNVRQIFLQAFLEKRLAEDQFTAYVTSCGLGTTLEKLTHAPALKDLDVVNDGEARGRWAQWWQRLQDGQFQAQTWQRLMRQTGGEQEDWEQLMKLREQRRI